MNFHVAHFGQGVDYSQQIAFPKASALTFCNLLEGLPTRTPYHIPGSMAEPHLITWLLSFCILYTSLLVQKSSTLTVRNEFYCLPMLIPVVYYPFAVVQVQVFAHCTPPKSALKSGPWPQYAT